MSEYGATMQTFNQELVKCLEDLKNKRNEILQYVNKEEQEKKELEKQMRILKQKLDNINNNLDQHKALYNHYEKTIQETELGFKKILESSHLLLNLAKEEASKLSTGRRNL